MKDPTYQGAEFNVTGSRSVGSNSTADLATQFLIKCEDARPQGKVPPLAGDSWIVALSPQLDAVRSRASCD